MLPRVVALPRIALVLSVLVLAAATAGVAASRQAAPRAADEIVVVPDVRRQPYVFAKGALEDAGFAWRVRGPVRGFAANTVVGQSPAPGTRLVDTGTPRITLTLARNKAYAEKGTPEDLSPFRGTAVRLAGRPAARATARTTAAVLTRAPKAKRDLRTPAFAVPGAPKEPRHEITLVARARALDAWLAKHRKPSAANLDHWSYQHSWIVTGAGFGWSHGEAALRVLVAVDRKVERRWGYGAASRVVAERALAGVRERSR